MPWGGQAAYYKQVIVQLIDKNRAFLTAGRKMAGLPRLVFDGGVRIFYTGWRGAPECNRISSKNHISTTKGMVFA